MSATTPKSISFDVVEAHSIQQFVDGELKQTPVLLIDDRVIAISGVTGVELTNCPLAAEKIAQKYADSLLANKD